GGIMCGNSVWRRYGSRASALRSAGHHSWVSPWCWRSVADCEPMNLRDHRVSATPGVRWFTKLPRYETETSECSSAHDDQAHGSRWPCLEKYRASHMSGLMKWLLPRNACSTPI